MLEQLYINNIAVIERASISLANGFTVLTGETGAGKSIIVDAINAVLGERTSRELVRSGASEANVSALFSDLSPEVGAILDEFSIPREEGNTLLIQRSIKAEGRATCKCNGAPVTVSMLRELGPHLVTIHGQHESYELRSPDIHISYIDQYGDLESLLQQYQSSFHRLRDIQQELDSFHIDEAEKARRLDLLRYQIHELESANIQLGERDELSRQREIIRNSERIADVLERVKGLLLGDEDNDGLLSAAAQASGELDRAVAYLPKLESAAGKLHEVGYLLEDVDRSLRNIDTDFDPTALDAIEERLDQLYRLGTKYGDTEEKMLHFLDQCQTQLQEITFSDEKREELEQAYEAEKQVAISLARELSNRRRHAAANFVEQVKNELFFLNMPGVELISDIQRVPLYSMGCDKIQFLVSANRGEEARPLSKVASGGELSRIMLAIKTVLSGKDSVDTLIFDEVDTGISGAAAAKVGQKLKQVAKNHQVLCITHLAQIASMADNHLRIVKEVQGDRTYTKVEPLNHEGRKQELARIIGGDAVTDLQLQMAEEMLRNA